MLTSLSPHFLFSSSFTPWVFTEYLLCARHCSPFLVSSQSIGEERDTDARGKYNGVVPKHGYDGQLTSSGAGQWGARRLLSGGGVAWLELKIKQHLGWGVSQAKGTTCTMAWRQERVAGCRTANTSLVGEHPTQDNRPSTSAQTQALVVASAPCTPPSTPSLESLCMLFTWSDILPRSTFGPKLLNQLPRIELKLMQKPSEELQYFYWRR